MKKIVHVIGGGTLSHVRSHLALCAPAYGTTARKIAELCRQQDSDMEVALHLTRMADPTSHIETAADIASLVALILVDPRTKIIFFNPAIADFEGTIAKVKSGKYVERPMSKEPTDGTDLNHIMELWPINKIINTIRNAGAHPRKDIFLIGFKETCGAEPLRQYYLGLNMLKRSSCNLVLANDVKTRINMIITPEEAVYHETHDRDEVLAELVDMAYLRSHLTFTHSTVISGKPVPWDSSLIPGSLRTVVDYCIAKGAYKKFRGVTAGHFAIKIGAQTFLTSRRKTDFNDMKHVGLVRVETDGPDSVIAYGSKPSVGGQSQRIVFHDHPGYDCVIHFHCPIKESSAVPVVSQREFECGSHECGKNTSNGLKTFGNLKAVYLDSHGPNIVFHNTIDPQEVIRFIEANFRLEEKTGGYMV